MIDILHPGLPMFLYLCYLDQSHTLCSIPTLSAFFALIFMLTVIQCDYLQHLPRLETRPITCLIVGHLNSVPFSFPSLAGCALA